MSVPTVAGRRRRTFGGGAGRVMQTSLSALTLEIYYRYLPLFKAEAGGGDPGAGPAAAAKPAVDSAPEKKAEKAKAPEAENTDNVL